MTKLSPQCSVLLNALKSGETLTPLDSLRKYHVLALSQRMTELKKLGWPVRTELVKMGTKHIARYSLES
jgi:hypothetical protein